jgi:hypothetical protein
MTSTVACAWCRDPGDANGSHGICAKHAAELQARSKVRQERKRVVASSIMPPYHALPQDLAVEFNRSRGQRHS